MTLPFGLVGRHNMAFGCLATHTGTTLLPAGKIPLPDGTSLLPLCINKRISSSTTRRHASGGLWCSGDTVNRLRAGTDDRT